MDPRDGLDGGGEDNPLASARTEQRLLGLQPTDIARNVPVKELVLWALETQCGRALTRKHAQNLDGNGSNLLTLPVMARRLSDVRSGRHTEMPSLLKGYAVPSGKTTDAVKDLGAFTFKVKQFTKKALRFLET